MTRSIVGITQSQVQAVDTIKGLVGRRARIHARRLHVEDIDITLHVVVADDPSEDRDAEPAERNNAAIDKVDRKYHRNIRRQARS